MEENYQYRFELKPGRFVFVPTVATIAFGRQVIDTVNSLWQPNGLFYHYGKRGGHVAAMRPHLKSRFFASVDLSNFFGNVTKTKVIRSLKNIGVSPGDAFDIASASCVALSGKKFLPYGFPQSMVLATLAVELSALGSALMSIRGTSVRVTMYVDDILLSSDDKDSLNAAYNLIFEGARISNFAISELKCSPPSGSVTAFNCDLEPGSMNIIDGRIKKFVENYMLGSEACQFAIERYIGVINDEQLKDFLKLVSS